MVDSFPSGDKSDTEKMQERRLKTWKKTFVVKTTIAFDLNLSERDESYFLQIKGQVHFLGIFNKHTQHRQRSNDK